MSSDQQILMPCRVLADQSNQTVADGIVHQLEALMNGATSGDGAIGSGDEVEVVEPLMDQLGAADGDSDRLRVDAYPAEVPVLRTGGQGADGNPIGSELMLG